MQKTIKPGEASGVPGAEVLDDNNTGSEDTSSFTPAIRRGAGALAAPVAELDTTGIQPPWLSIVHGVGKLAQAGYNPGSLVLGGEHVLAEKNTPINLTVLRYQQYWKQYLSNEDFSAGLRPRLFANAEEAKKAGLRVEWENNMGPEASPAMDWLLLIEKPKDLICGLFGINILDKEYAVALMTVDKQAYTAVASTFVNAVRFALKERGVYSANWALSTIIKKSQRNPAHSAWIPQLKLAGYHTEEFTTALKGAFA